MESEFIGPFRASGSPPFWSGGTFDGIVVSRFGLYDSSSNGVLASNGVSGSVSKGVFASLAPAVGAFSSDFVEATLSEVLKSEVACSSLEASPAPELAPLGSEGAGLSETLASSWACDRRTVVTATTACQGNEKDKYNC